MHADDQDYHSGDGSTGSVEERKVLKRPSTSEHTAQVRIMYTYLHCSVCTSFNRLYTVHKILKDQLVASPRFKHLQVIILQN